MEKSATETPHTGARDTMKYKPKKVNWKTILAKVQGKDAYEKTCVLGKKILELLGATRPETAQSGKDAYDQLCECMGKANSDLDGLSKNTFIQYLSKAAASLGTDIFCEGRKQGYYVRKEEAIGDDEGDTKPTHNQRGEEKLLYPVAERWLGAQSFRAAIIAKKKKNGIWGNPDVVGVKVHEWFEQRKLELVTIECKNSLDGWKSQFFEAVAHKRFADRVYFAFVLPVDEVEKRYKELVEYAEFYGVGLLVLEMGEKVFKRYNERNSAVADDLELLEFREIYPAPRNQCLVQPRMAFLQRLGLGTWEGLHHLPTNKVSMDSVPDREPAKPPKNEEKKMAKEHSIKVGGGHPQGPKKGK